MKGEPLVQVSGVGKSFVRRAGGMRWKDWIVRRERASRSVVDALHDVSFTVARGEMVGIVGANGAGKSTLLRLLGGIGRPSSGALEVRGRIGGLLDLGGGFQGDLTGRENAILASVVAGLLKQEALECLPSIVRFAGLENFIDAPVRTYSTGMTMRLAFAVAVHADPDVLLVDEYLSVGDLAFQAKCIDRISRMRADGCAVVLVSHGMDQIKEMCDRALWLRHGRVAAEGTPREVAVAYEEEMRQETLRRTPDASAEEAETVGLRNRENRFGSMEMLISGVDLRPRGGITSGGPLEVVIRYRGAGKRIASPAFSVSISKKDGTVCLDTNTQAAKASVPDVEGSGVIRLEIERLDLAPGDYFVDVGVFEPGWSHAYDYHWHVYPMRVTGGTAQRGILAPPCRWSAPPTAGKETTARASAGFPV